MFALFFLCVMLFLTGPLAIVPAVLAAIAIASLVVFVINKVRTRRNLTTPAV